MGFTQELLSKGLDSTPYRLIALALLEVHPDTGCFLMSLLLLEDVQSSVQF